MDVLTASLCSTIFLFQQFWMLNKPNQFDIIWPALCSSSSLTASESIWFGTSALHYNITHALQCTVFLLFLIFMHMSRTFRTKNSVCEVFINWFSSFYCCTFFSLLWPFSSQWVRCSTRPFDLHSNSNQFFFPCIHVNKVTSCSLTVYTHIPNFYWHLHCIIICNGNIESCQPIPLFLRLCLHSLLGKNANLYRFSMLFPFLFVGTCSSLMHSVDSQPNMNELVRWGQWVGR